MAETIFVLPDRDALANALVGVSGTGHRVQNLYPVILRNAGSKVTPMGFVTMWSLAMSDYAKDFLPVVRSQLAMDMHNYAKAIVTDPAVLAEVLDVFAAVGWPTGRENNL
jgi:hypothetical protein